MGSLAVFAARDDTAGTGCGCETGLRGLGGAGTRGGRNSETATPRNFATLGGTGFTLETFFFRMPTRTISIRGARTHNLKNVSVEIPQRQLTVLTGPSGSGKSSLAFNTLYAEGQRRFVESMSTYVRQFLERIDRPDVDEIEGILPAISIEQKNSVKNARSTVATATELADHIRLFMTYCGETWCPDCGVQVRKETPQSITAEIASSLAGKRVVVLAPIFFEAENRQEVLTQLVKAGFYR